jgi:hypothetical protein
MGEMSREDRLRHWALTEKRERGLLAALSGVLSTATVQEAVKYLNHNELGLALETIVAALHDTGVRPADSVREEIRSIAESMGIADDLPSLP